MSESHEVFETREVAAKLVDDPKVEPKPTEEHGETPKARDEPMSHGDMLNEDPKPPEKPKFSDEAKVSGGVVKPAVEAVVEAPPDADKVDAGIPLPRHFMEDDDLVRMMSSRRGFYGQGGDDDEPKKVYKLPTNVKPKHYDLTLRPDLERFRFEGEVSILLDILEDTDSIVLNVHSSVSIKSLAIHYAVEESEIKERHVFDVSLMHYSFMYSGAGSAKLNSRAEQLTMTIPEKVGKLVKGQDVEVLCGFSGNIGEKPDGLYRCAHSINPDHKLLDETQHYAVTQFNQSSARRVFPCFDQPNIKASFTVRLISQLDKVSLTCMPMDDEVYWSGQSRTRTMKSAGGQFQACKITRFQKTPPIATHMLGMAVGEFESLQSSYTSSNGKKIPLAVYSVPEMRDQGHFALFLIEKGMTVLEELFGIPYALPKLDILAIANMDRNGKDNYGLLTGTFNSLFIHPDNAFSSAASKLQVTRFVLQEMVHMWFGAYVGPAHWSEIWLKEGFAEFISSYILYGRLFPEWKTRDHFYITSTLTALRDGCFKSSFEAASRNQERETVQMNKITSNKTAALLQMTYAKLGDAAFFQSVHKFLDRPHSIGTSQELWEAFGSDTKTSLESWISQPGFPAIVVGENELKQVRFCANESVHEQPATNWKIHLNSDITMHESTIPKTDVDFGTGLFRILHRPEDWLKVDALSPIAKASRISDAFAFAQTGDLPTTTALDVLRACSTSRDVVVWDVITQVLYDLTKWTDVSKFCGRIVQALVDELGYDEHNGDFLKSSLQARVIALSTNAKVDKTLEELHKRWEPFYETDDESEIAVDMRASTFKAAVYKDGSSAWQIVKDVYLDVLDYAEKADALFGLCSSDDPEIIERAIGLLRYGQLDEPDVKDALCYLADNPAAKSKVWEYIRDQWHLLVRKQAGDDSLWPPLSEIVVKAFSNIDSREELDKLKAFAEEKKSSKKYQAWFDKVVEQVECQLKWKERDGEAVTKWLNDNGYT